MLPFPYLAISPYWHFNYAPVNNALEYTPPVQPAVVELFKSASALGQVCDITDNDALQRVVEAVIQTFGGLDILVPNAGILPSSLPIEAVDADVWDKYMDINLSNQ